MSLKNWEHFFKPEVRSSGKTLVNQDKVSVSSSSDTEVTGFIRSTSPVKVTLKSDSIGSSVARVSCNCPVSVKGNFCKHIWATLLKASDKFPDFFANKLELEKSATIGKLNKPSSSVKSESFIEAQKIYKEKQNQYRKEQYQKQKARLKELKKGKPEKESPPPFPSSVEAALQFFSENGIELREALNRETVAASKKKLARLFHPDAGGSHDEILLLNKNTEILLTYVNGNS